MRLLLTILLGHTLLCAQNLVVNPGFEEVDTAFRMPASQVLFGMGLTGWSAPTDGTPDYIHLDPPSRTGGITLPFEGSGYVRFYGQGSFEYVKGNLSESLEADVTYTVSITLATEKHEPSEEKKVGIYFTDDPDFSVKGKGYQFLDVKPQIRVKNTIAVSTRGEWTTYQTTFTAKGGESAFVIGCFERGTNKAGFFYIDSVFIGTPAEQPQAEPEDIEDTVAVSSLPVAVDTIALVENEDAIAPGKTLTLQNIYFETNKSRILPESYQALYDIIIEMKLQPNLKVEIVGHTDAHGKPADNQKLSEERAKAVADFFISKGIDPSRITTKGYGSSQPLGDDDQKNRRVEFIFTE